MDETKWDQENDTGGGGGELDDDKVEGAWEASESPERRGEYGGHEAGTDNEEGRSGGNYKE
jgi:hypothetical protein